MPSLPFDKLNETNYDDWKIQMEALLEEKDLFCVINGRLPHPSPAQTQKLKAYQEKQRTARAKIILAVEPSQLPHIRNEEDPAVIWQNLARIHRARGLGVLLTMRMDFLKMTMSPGSTIASFVADIRLASFRLQECYQAEADDTSSSSPSPLVPSSTKLPVISEIDKISVLLNGLPPTYQAVIVSITGTPISSLNFENVVTRLMNEEGRLRHTKSPSVSPQTTSTAPSDDVAAAITMTSEKPGSRIGGATRWKGKSGSKPTSQITCHKCGGVGHYRQHCPTKDEDALQANAALEEVEESSAHTVVASDDFGDAW